MAARLEARPPPPPPVPAGLPEGLEGGLPAPPRKADERPLDALLTGLQRRLAVTEVDMQVRGFHWAWG